MTNPINRQPSAGSLYSLADLRSIIEPILMSTAPRTVCEIGVEKGRFTGWLCDFCRSSGCSYTGIDVGLTPQVVSLGNGSEARYVRGLSLEVLPDLPVQDAYFIDGDHNYHTVLNELRLIFRDDRAPLVFLHDVGWPWGRRDMYYAPDTVPAAHRHPYSWDYGPVPGKENLEAWGHGSRYGDFRFAVAEAEGGPANGVLTAVEDFMKDSPPHGGWRFILVPAVFGLGILVREASVKPALQASLGRLEAAVSVLGPLMQTVEMNRLSIFADFLECFAHGESLGRAYDELNGTFHNLESSYKALDKHAADLLEAYRDLEKWAHETARQRDELVAAQGRDKQGAP